MMVMAGYVFPSTNTISNIPVAIANLDEGPDGTIFYNQLKAVNDASGMMVLSDAQSYDDIKTQIQDGKISAGIVIAADFTADLSTGHQGNITVILDYTNPQMSLMGKLSGS